MAMLLLVLRLNEVVFLAMCLVKCYDSGYEVDSSYKHCSYDILCTICCRVFHVLSQMINMHV